MRRNLLPGLLVAAVMLVSTPAVRAQHMQQQLAPADRKALAEFSHRADDYMRMEQKLPAAKPKPDADMAHLQQQRETLQKAVQQARRGTPQGNLFTPEAGEAFRHLIAQVFASADGQKSHTSLQHAEPNAPANLVVNQPYPNRKGEPVQSVPATLLHELPPLPKGLEYRIAGKQLAIRDRSANLVVDILPDALP